MDASSWPRTLRITAVSGPCAREIRTSSVPSAQLSGVLAETVPTVPTSCLTRIVQAGDPPEGTVLGGATTLGGTQEGHAPLSGPLGTRSGHQQSSRTPRPRGRLARRAATALALVGALVAVVAPAQATRTATAPAAHSSSARTVQSIRVPADYFGMQDGSSESYQELSYGSTRLWDVGATWRDIETAPGVYDWSRLDTLVGTALAHGTEVTAVLAMTPSFYSPAAHLPPTDLGAYRAFVRAVMTRYDDFHGRQGIATYQVWNEGNVPYFWQGSPQQLARLTQIVWQERNAHAPDAQVLAPSFAVRLPYQRTWVSQYLAQVVGGRPVWRYVDATAFSLYPTATLGRRIAGPEDAMALLDLTRDRLAAAGVPASLPIWSTEINYGVNSQGTATTPVGEQQQVANVIRTYVLGAARGLARMYWYRYDWGQVPGGTLGNTLLSVPGSPDRITPAGEAFGTAQRWLKGRLVGVHGRRPCARDARGTYTCLVRYAGGLRTILWNPRHDVRVPMPVGARTTQTPQGVTTRVAERRGTLRVSYLPVMVVSAG